MKAKKKPVQSIKIDELGLDLVRLAPFWSIHG
jgi:hypothetical protein